jgi:hypothetical protein
LAISAHEWYPPALTLTAVEAADDPVIPVTATGTLLAALELLPNWPKLFRPQHFTVPSAIRAQATDAVMCTVTAVFEDEAPSIPRTAIGMRLSVFEPSPNWPSTLNPQHFTVPLAMSAQVLPPPAVTLTAVVAGVNPVIPDTKTGAKLLLVVPLPNWPDPLLPQHLTVPFAITAHE